MLANIIGLILYRVSQNTRNDIIDAYQNQLLFETIIKLQGQDTRPAVTRADGVVLNANLVSFKSFNDEINSRKNQSQRHHWLKFQARSHGPW